MSEESSTATVPPGPDSDRHQKIEIKSFKSDALQGSFGFAPPEEIKKAEREPIKFFECGDCGLHEEYHYFGKTPPFCKAIVFLEDSYVARDPFSPHTGNTANFLLLGSNCTACLRMTCQECSTFFSKRFCAQCFKNCSTQLPEELRAKKKAKD